MTSQKYNSIFYGDTNPNAAKTLQEQQRLKKKKIKKEDAKNRKYRDNRLYIPTQGIGA